MTTHQHEQYARRSDWQLLAEFSLPHETEEESLVVELITEALRGLALAPARLEQLQIILTDAVRKTIQRGASYQFDPAVSIRVFVPKVGIEDLPQGATADETGGQAIESSTQETEESRPRPARAWGYFLIGRLIDSPSDLGGLPRRAIELFLYAEGGKRDARSAQTPPPEQQL